MHKTLLSAAATLAISMAAGAALAQTEPTSPTPSSHHAHKAHKPHAAHAATGEKPVDNGPNTPDANAAYQGGGVVLQGAPGAPAPAPQATPPGEAPAGAVPH